MCGLILVWESGDKSLYFVLDGHDDAKTMIGNESYIYTKAYHQFSPSWLFLNNTYGVLKVAAKYGSGSTDVPVVESIA